MVNGSSQLNKFWKSIIILSLLLALGSVAYAVNLKSDNKNTETTNKDSSTGNNNDKGNSDKSIKPVASNFSEPAEAAKEASQSVYYPTNLPKGFSSNNDFEVINKNVVTYSVKDSEGHIYSVTQQPLQAGFSQDVFAKNLKGVTRLNTPIGNALIGERNTELLASIEIRGKAWVLVNAPEAKLRSHLETVVRNLRPVSG